ncbi:hypothetical protein Sango_0799700 [Sesamum angolense]|uniref:RNase H type-1 domain-containing protein n=1 Tax=Sesamum angolense TaxID=2727404 RepID=A0AAE1X379_9LAMI|nr:hypothetical protein Sango_0799700 [Sesamum angolense]
MCTDFKDLKKACLKDFYPLPQIDQLVDSTSGFELLSMMDAFGAGIVITYPQGEDLEFAVKFSFKAPNNKAEYEALVIGMKMAHEEGTRHLVAYSNSQLIVKKVEGAYEAKEGNMI